MSERGPRASVLGGRNIRFDEMASAYQGVLSQQEEGPDEVVVEVEIAPDDAQPFTVELRLQRAEGYWRVIAFSNLAQTFGSLMERGI